MTTFVYAEKNGLGIMACDSQVSIGGISEPFEVNKALEIDVNGKVVILTAGEARYIDIWRDLAIDFAESVAEYNTESIPYDNTESCRGMQSLEGDFLNYINLNITEVLNYFKEVQGIELYHGPEGGSGKVSGEFLICSEKHGCHSFDCSLSHSRVTNYVSGGSGGDAARAILALLYDRVESDEELRTTVKKAMEVACEVDAYSGKTIRYFEFDVSKAPSIEELNRVCITQDMNQFYMYKAVQKEALEEERTNALSQTQ